MHGTLPKSARRQTRQTQPKPRQKRRNGVDLLTHENAQCILLGMLGFSDWHIMDETGLAPWQISYRLKLANVKRRDYRDGRNAAARATEGAALREFGQFLADQVSAATGQKIVNECGRLFLR